jgi:hypothetical protein
VRFSDELREAPTIAAFNRADVHPVELDDHCLGADPRNFGFSDSDSRDVRPNRLTAGPRDNFRIKLTRENRYPRAGTIAPFTEPSTPIRAKHLALADGSRTSAVRIDGNDRTLYQRPNELEFHDVIATQYSIPCLTVMALAHRKTTHEFGEDVPRRTAVQSRLRRTTTKSFVDYDGVARAAAAAEGDRGGAGVYETWKSVGDFDRIKLDDKSHDIIVRGLPDRRNA